MADQPKTPEVKTILGHPLGLYVLFFAEMWERFSFYGMKTLLILYMLNSFFWNNERASHLMGIYTFLAYGVPIIGGFLADRFFGAKKAVVYGAILLSMGHFLMVFSPMWCFYGALGLIIAGVGLLKPNISTQVGSLYKPDDPRRDGAFTIFYMGINLGAFFGPLICDWLRVHYGYHYGFGAAGVGMVFGLLVYIIGQRRLVEFNQEVPDEDPKKVAVAKTPEHPPHVVRDRVIVLLIVFAFVILFWAAFEQSGNSILVWADQHSNLRPFSTEPPPLTVPGEVTDAVETAGTSWAEYAIPSGWSQSFNPFFIITLAPVFAFLWMWLDKRKLQPSTPGKMVMGIFLVAVAYACLWPATAGENQPCSVQLAKLPIAFDVDQEGRISSPARDDDGKVKIGTAADDRVFYGATRLRYDATNEKLMLKGVLIDLDRYRLLAESAPEDFHDAVRDLEAKAKKKSNEVSGGEKWEVSEVIAAVPADFKIVGDEAEKALKWNAAEKTLTATAEINLRARTQLLACAAEPEFKTAVDKIYVESGKSRVSIWWLLLFFMVLTMGELCLSPVGLSLVTKLAPRRQVGLCMGGWFLATAIAEYAAHYFSGWWGKMTPDNFFMMFVIMCLVGAALMAVLIKTLKRMMHGVH